MKNNIAAIRQQKNLQQKELAEIVGIGNDWLCDIEKGKGKPSMDLLEKLANALKCEIRDFF
ncbi:helix-turn-helix domain-containing protein [Heyndrickxia sp. MSNUG]|uniref:helix-turn-helix domain-containing protein n=1 Tax=Heyndrickxia sp. MSNUG TaxID=3136677 RepID=UPI003C2E359C